MPSPTISQTASAPVSTATATGTPAVDETPVPVSMLPGARVLARAEVGPGPSSTAWAGGRLWLGDEFGLAELDPTDGTILRRLELGPLASVAAVPGADKLVVASYVEEYVAVLDPSTDALIDRTHVPCPRELGVQSVTEVWVTAPCIDQVARVVIGREVAGIVRVSQPGPIAIGGGAIWVVGDQSVVRIDPSTMSKTTVYPVMLGFPADIAFLESASMRPGCGSLPSMFLHAEAVHSFGSILKRAKHSASVRVSRRCRDHSIP